MTEETDHAKSQAKAQYESICEMIESLEIDGAANQYAADLTREECVTLLEDNSIDTYDDEDLETLREAVAENIIDGTIEPDDFEFDEDEARQRIQEDPLEVAVRSGWSSSADSMEAEDFLILLCTGGPAVRIRGELDQHCQPDRAWLEYQDWGTPWTRYFDASQDVLLRYAQQFYFGE